MLLKDLASWENITLKRHNEILFTSTVYFQVNHDKFYIETQELDCNFNLTRLIFEISSKKYYLWSFSTEALP